MPLRSQCEMLPDEIRDWLDSELRRRRHTGFVELSALLAERGYRIGKSAIGKYSIALRRRDGVPLCLDTRPIKSTETKSAPKTARTQLSAAQRWLKQLRKTP